MKKVKMLAVAVAVSLAAGTAQARPQSVDFDVEYDEMEQYGVPSGMAKPKALMTWLTNYGISLGTRLGEAAIKDIWSARWDPPGQIGQMSGVVDGASVKKTPPPKYDR